MNITNITVSYSRKLNHQYYGGGQYESSDHFISLSAEVDEGEDILKAHKELKQGCKEMVEEDMFNEIQGLSGGLSWGEFETYLRDLSARRPIDGETYHACNQLQKNILQAVKRGLQMQKRDESKDIRYEPSA